MHYPTSRSDDAGLTGVVMSEAARRDFSPLVIGTTAPPGSPAATIPNVLAKQPNLVALAAAACVTEALAVIGALWASYADLPRPGFRV